MAACFSRIAVIMWAMVLMALLSVGQGQYVDRVVEKGCPLTEYAYSFQSTCQYPAEFGTPYHLVAPFSNERVAMGGLTTSGSAVQFTGDKSDEGAQYVLKAVSPSEGSNITVQTTFTIQNVDTKRFLGYEFIEPTYSTALIEVEEDHDVGVEIAHFSLTVACNVPLPCPTTYGARCLSYHLEVVNRGSLIIAEQKDGVTYPFVKGSIMLGTKTLPFLLRRVKLPQDMLIKEPVNP